MQTVEPDGAGGYAGERWALMQRMPAHGSQQGGDLYSGPVDMRSAKLALHRLDNGSGEKTSLLEELAVRGDRFGVF
jgi:hypothetical protein